MRAITVLINQFFCRVTALARFFSKDNSQSYQNNTNAQEVNLAILVSVASARFAPYFETMSLVNIEETDESGIGCRHHRG